ncbi:MAG: hypothetical protein HY728_09610 [Candidatus Rokubacteria bacterium]|nr:hypothetical protein [Candidatus Rokubacteria bacterium]MBI4594459.1 hypothetical protein [Candidatus Rokubacteria bacterium]
MDLWRIAEEETRQAGLGIGPDCANLLRHTFDRARAHAQPISSGVEWDTERNTRILVQTMIDIARERGYAELHEDTFADALRRVCPLFPFC